MEGPLFCMCTCDALSLKPRTCGSSLHVMSDTEKEEMWLSLKYKNTKPCRWDVRLRGGPVTWLALVTGCFGVAEKHPAETGSASRRFPGQGGALPCSGPRPPHSGSLLPIWNCVSSPQALGSHLLSSLCIYILNLPKEGRKCKGKKGRKRKWGKVPPRFQKQSVENKCLGSCVPGPEPPSASL